MWTYYAVEQRQLAIPPLRKVFTALFDQIRTVKVTPVRLPHLLHGCGVEVWHIHSTRGTEGNNIRQSAHLPAAPSVQWRARCADLDEDFKTDP